MGERGVLPASRNQTIRELITESIEYLYPKPGIRSTDDIIREKLQAALDQLKTVYYCPDCDQHSENRNDFEEDCRIEAYLWARLPDPGVGAESACEHEWRPSADGSVCARCQASDR